MSIEDPIESAAAVQGVTVPIPSGAFQLRAFAGAAGIIMGSGLVSNVFNYLYHFTLSRRLGPDAYGTLTTILAIAAIVAVIGASISVVAMQETARMWAAQPHGRITAFVRRVGLGALGVSAITGAAIVSISVPLARYLHVVQPGLWIVFALYVAVSIFSGFIRGAAQGAHRFGLYAGSIVSESIVKLVCGVVFVGLGYAVFGAVGALLVGAGVGLLVALLPVMVGPTAHAPRQRDYLSLGGEALKVLYVTVATTGLLFVDMVFAKHHLSGIAAGYYGAAGTIARTIPYAAGFVALVLMPKAAAAQHVDRRALRRLLLMAFGLVLAVITMGLVAVLAWPHVLLHVAYGRAFEAAAPIVRLYGIDGALLALGMLATNYLIATREYGIGAYLLGALVIEAIVMALFGNTPVRLLTTAIAVNAALIPIFAWFLARSLRAAPQATGPLAAEATK